MIDHVLGRPSVKFRKVQVFAVVAFWSLYLVEGNRNGPPILRTLSKKLSKRLTPWHTVVLTMLWLYLSRNFAKIFGLESPEPEANLYSRSFFRATWITTALDAGFWTAMRIKPPPLRNLASFIFSVYYLFATAQATAKVRSVRAALTVDHLRISWNKSTTPYLSFMTSLLRPTFTRYPPRKLLIPRPTSSSYRDPITAWLYFDGPLSSLSQHDKIVLDIPGGGFVAMGPRNNDDKLLAWAGKLGIPVLSLEYRKAPEWPYPYALNECFDAYAVLQSTRGRCIGLSGSSLSPLKIVLAGDSAGGNLAAGVVLMILQQSKLERQALRASLRTNADGQPQLQIPTTSLPLPEGLILVYPALDMNINSWMTDEQMSLIRDQRTRAGNRRILRKKSMDYYSLDPATPAPSEDDEDARMPAPDYFGLKSRASSAVFSDDGDGSSTIGGTNNLLGSIERLSTNSGAIDTTNPTLSPLTPSTPLPLITPTSNPNRVTLRTRLAMSSKLSYFSDRVLTPEMMRAMIILYIGPYTRPDFSTDYLLSPLLAPEHLLASFPPTFFLTGERDPLVDDTVLMAGRLRQAKYQHWLGRREMGLLSRREEKRGWRDEEVGGVRVVLVEGASHGFMQFVGVWPEGWRWVKETGEWVGGLLGLDSRDGGGRRREGGGYKGEREVEGRGDVVKGEVGMRDVRDDEGNKSSGKRWHHRRLTESSVEEERPLEMTRINGGSGKKNHGNQSKHSGSRSSSRGKGSGSRSGNGGGGDGNGGDGEKKIATNGGANRANRAKTEAEKATRARQKVKPDPISRPKSEDDLLKRRMKGLAEGLMGSGEE